MTILRHPAQQSGPVDIAALLQTEVEILLSRPVMETVVDVLNLENQPESQSAISRFKASVARGLAAMGLRIEADKKERWVQALLLDTEAEFGANSQSLHIKYAHNQPQVAAAIVRAITQSYVAYRLEVHKLEGLTDFYEEQATESKERLNAAIREVEEYRNEHALGAIAESRGSQGSALAKMIEEENRLRREHIEISDKFGPEHANSTRSLRKIEQAEERIRALQGSLAVLEQRETVVNNMLALINAEQSNYLNYLALKEAAKVSALSNPNTTNVRLIENAAVPQVPVVSRLFLIALGLFGGIALGVTISMIREYFDNRVLRSAELEQIMGISVFAVLAASDLEQ